MSREEKIELFKKFWYSRNPCHEHDFETGEDRFWGTAALVAEEYAEALQEWEKEKDEWIKLEKGCEMPDYDVPVIWLDEHGNCVVESLDKDGNPWLFGEATSEGFTYPKATHWRPLPTLPISDTNVQVSDTTEADSSSEAEATK